ncbi:MAG: hypothetical protein R3F16_02430 [Myxococcota bacterium]
MGRAVRSRVMRWLACLLLLPILAACSEGGSSPAPIVVDSLLDAGAAPVGAITLREALAEAASGQPIVFDAALDGGTIGLTQVAQEHSVLKGEVMGIRNEPSGPVSYLVGWFERDYGRSALYARKQVVLDASALPSGITIAWLGGAMDPARVLAVYGDLTLRNVSITGGVNVAEDISATNPDQPWTLARGGGLAVWGRAQLSDCEIHDNHVEGDFDPSRDRGAFGGGVYANILQMTDCVVAGNSVLGGGAAGGGVYSVGGATIGDAASTIERSTVSGNRIQGLFTYGGGVYSDGGGIGNRKRLVVRNSTIARNLVETAPGLPPFVLATGYWRGGGIYLSNGYLTLKASTVVENEVHGVPRTDDLGKPNLAGGIAATIGNAHAIEDLVVGHSVIAGNTVHEVGGATWAHDLFTGSTFYYRSLGYNRIGVIDFSQMLAPVGQSGWSSLVRRHFPQVGDETGLGVDEVVDRTSGITRSAHIRSVGTDDGAFTVLRYEPWDRARDVIPASIYEVSEVYGEYAIAGGGTDDFLAIVLGRIEDRFVLTGFAATFTADFEAFLQSVDLDDGTPGLQPYLDPNGAPIVTLAATRWFGPAQTWPKELPNHPWIHFWHRLDDALLAEGLPALGPEVLGDVAWETLFAPGRLAENPDITLSLARIPAFRVRLELQDQQGVARPAGTLGDVGAIERP